MPAGIIHSTRFVNITAPLTYSTSFPATENPISQSGIWVNGGSVGGNWNNVRTTPGLAFGAATVSSTDDCLAHLNLGFLPSQSIEGTVFKAGGYSPPDSHEIELLTRWSIALGVSRGYEVNWQFAGICQIVRWNGSLGDFTVIGSDVDIGAAVTGDKLKVTVVGSNIKVYKNSVEVRSETDSTWTTGNPGIGFFPRTGATLASYGWSHIDVTEL